MNYDGILIGLATFLLIGFFHPIVIKAEYYCGRRIWWAFLLVGLACCGLSMLCKNTNVSIRLGVTGFSSLWGIGEVFQQHKRVERGWFPMNPKRKACYHRNDASQEAKEHAEK